MNDKDSITTPERSALQPTKKQVTLTSLRARVAAKEMALANIDPMTLENRLVFQLDLSGSMCGHPEACLKDAVSAFIDHCDQKDTSIGCFVFPDKGELGNQQVTIDYTRIRAAIYGLRAAGGTPMAESMNYVLNAMPATRCVLVSDGAPDYEPPCYEAATMYREAGIPIDCIHIGSSAAGEEVLQKIADMTGGKFIKFTDVNQLVGGLKYLTPSMYGMLTSGAVTAEDIGAREIK